MLVRYVIQSVGRIEMLPTICVYLVVTIKPQKLHWELNLEPSAQIIPCVCLGSCQLKN